MRVKNVMSIRRLFKFQFLILLILSGRVVLLANPYESKDDVTPYYVSSTGKPSGDGSEASPWDLQTALNQPAAVKAGSTICIQPGTYKGNFTSNLRGTSSAPIVVKNCSGGRVIIDGSRAGQVNKNITTLLINGAYTWFWGLEVTNSDPERIITQSGSNPQERRGAGIAIFAPGIKLINLIVYDNGEGIDAWTPAENCEVYGNIIFNNGWWAPDREHGHGIYTQNNTGTKKFIDNFVLNNFSYAWQVYGSNQSSLKNFYIEGNTVFNDRWLIGGAAPMENVELRNNFTYRDTLQIGYFSNVLNKNLILRNNFFASLLKIYYWNNVDVVSNTLFTGSTYNYPVLFSFEGVPDFSTFRFDSNTYYWSTPPPAHQAQVALAWENNKLPEDDPNFDGLYQLDQWQASGQDKKATVKNWPKKDAANMALSGSNVFLRKNKYDDKRANLTVYNWDHSDVVNIDVNGFLSAGDSYELRNVQDYFGDVITGIYYGGELSVPMNNHTVAKPLGYHEELGPNTLKEFGAFLLINKGVQPDSIAAGIFQFAANKENNHIVLNWNTATDPAAKYYAIERSADGVRFDSIGVLQARSITEPVIRYQYLDFTPAHGDNHYRLKKVFGNNNHVYTRPQKVVFSVDATSFLILGNPVADALKLNIQLKQPSKVIIRLSGASGQVYLTLQESLNAGSFLKELPISHLAAGTYFLTVTTDGKAVTRSFMRK
jgi:hypothetical protein